MKIFTPVLAFPLFLMLLLTSCISDQVEVVSVYYSETELQALQQFLDLPAERDKYTVVLADHLANSSSFAPFINDAKATLGRVLFYDTQLSRTGETSCASCHKQALAFSDDKAFSTGINGQQTERNSLSLAAVANFASSYDSGGPDFGPPNGFGRIGFFWDERAGSISEQSSLTIENDIEMGMDINELPGKLAQNEYYKILFRKAYGDEVVTTQRLLEAIQEFVNSFVATQSRFDEGLNVTRQLEQDFPNFSALENRGKALFIENCSTCHAADMSTPMGVNMASNGLEREYTDLGLGGLTQNPADFGIFKVPFLRNVALTAPYMHDGRFATLEAVVDHYSSGIQANDNLSEQLRFPDGSPRRFNFSAQDKAALVAFLHTVTDEQFIAESRFSDPFR
ncbi:MAG: cytochrome-c peroxidase [Bacteroidetes bacterium]|nr:MAG: cytochrome-c peroxidase [Bacteroidota bacterium]PTM11785.1 MAG: cytochrome-c peroxidase [Bacteroidota bacterium]